MQAIITSISQAAAQGFSFFNNRQNNQAAAQATRNNQAAAQAARNQQILAGLLFLVAVIIIVIALKKK